MLSVSRRLKPASYPDVSQGRGRGGIYRMHLGMQMEDLYHFMRKAMEKHDWSLKLGTSMLETYSKILPLSDTDRTCLYYLFLYPENTGNRSNFLLQCEQSLDSGQKYREIEGPGIAAAASQ